jgi:hypothetical protein
MQSKNIDTLMESLRPAPATGFPTANDWKYLSGPFGLSALPANSYPSQADELTELDWAVRADSSVVAVVTPFNININPTVQYGCWAVNLNLLGTGSPFSSVAAVAQDYDTDGPNGTNEEQGSNGCTYEPASNTGIVIVRHLVNGSISQPDLYNLYALIDAGIFP